MLVVLLLLLLGVTGVYAGGVRVELTWVEVLVDDDEEEECTDTEEAVPGDGGTGMLERVGVTTGLVSVIGQTVVETGMVLVTTVVLRAGQWVTEAAHEVMVISVVEKMVEVVYETTLLLLDDETAVVGETSVAEMLVVGAVYVITVSDGKDVYVPVQPVYTEGDGTVTVTSSVVVPYLGMPVAGPGELMVCTMCVV